MTQYTITLTAEEINILQIALCETECSLTERAQLLEEHNESGINTKYINLKRARALDCSNLWRKLYDCTK